MNIKVRAFLNVLKKAAVSIGIGAGAMLFAHYFGVMMVLNIVVFSVLGYLMYFLYQLELNKLSREK
jgi:hypothetical protein